MIHLKNKKKDNTIATVAATLFTLAAITTLLLQVLLQ